jgi:CRP-like cAMP-binding protein
MATSSNVFALLSKTALFAELPSADLQACSAMFREVRFGKGEMLFARGDPGRHLYLVAEGRVRIATSTDEGRELGFRHALPGELIGEIAALDGGPRTAEAMALAPVVAYSLERGALRDILARHPAVAVRFLDLLCKRLRETSDQLETIALHPLHIRLARFLLHRLGDARPPPGKRVPLELGMSQGELAVLLGATRPKVNEAFGALEQVGALARRIDRVFCDPAKLAETARGDDA